MRRGISFIRTWISKAHLSLEAIAFQAGFTLFVFFCTENIILTPSFTTTWLWRALIYFIY